MNAEKETVAPHHVMDWFTMNPTYIMPDADVPNSSHWSVDSAHGAIRIQWDATESTIRVDGFPSHVSSSADLMEFAGLTHHAVAASAAHRSLAQRELHHPLKYGLMQRPLSQANQDQPDVIWNPAPNRVAPERESECGMGWFAPDANPEKFGTLFVYPKEKTNGIDTETTTWCLGQIGRAREELDAAAWNDREAVEGLYQQVLDDNSEYHLTIASLGDSEGRLRQQKRLQEERQAIIAARAAFSRQRDRIRPRLVQGAVMAAFTAMPNSWKYDLCNESLYFHDEFIFSLKSPRVFGYGTQPTPMNVACRMSFSPAARSVIPRVRNNAPANPPILPPDHFDEYAAGLSKILDIRKLGIVLRTYDNGIVSFYVTKNKALFVEYAAAFGIEPGTAIDEYLPESRTWATIAQ